MPTCPWFHSFHVSSCHFPFLPGNPEVTGLLVCVVAHTPHLLQQGMGKGGNSQLTAEPQGPLEKLSQWHVWHLSSCIAFLKEQG